MSIDCSAGFFLALPASDVRTSALLLMQIVMAQNKPKLVCDGTLIFRRFRRDKHTGKVLDAHLYGLKAWPMCFGTWVTKEKAVPTSTT